MSKSCSESKLDEIVLKGKDATVELSPNICINCLVEIRNKNVISCKNCRCGIYCSRECMELHKNHKKYCVSICTLEKLEIEKRKQKDVFGVDLEKLPYKLKRTLIRLVGERPLVNFHLNEIKVEGLW